MLCASFSKRGTIKGFPKTSLYLLSIFKKVAGIIGTCFSRDKDTGPLGNAAS